MGISSTKIQMEIKLHLNQVSLDILSNKRTKIDENIERINMKGECFIDGQISIFDLPVIEVVKQKEIIV